MKRPDKKKNIELKFNAPVDENQQAIWIPIVAKNRDYILGYIDAWKIMSEVYELPMSDMLHALGSDRFNDVMPDGSRMQDLSKKDLKEKIKNIMLKPSRSEHIENTSDIYYENELVIECPGCRMVYMFKELIDIPKVNFGCSCCNRALIMYHHHDDDELTYDGESGTVEEIVREIHEDLIEEKNDDGYDPDEDGDSYNPNDEEDDENYGGD